MVRPCLLPRTPCPRLPHRPQRHFTLLLMSFIPFVSSSWNTCRAKG